ncbi:MAG: hypothetical protein PHS65_08060, partial [Arcobacteraceae bacterium]|nr:hypothetical protein [Arcobacteraceae bacterium]
MTANYLQGVLCHESTKTPLYALCDYETLVKKKISLEEFVIIVKSHNVKILQYRDKYNSSEIQKKHLTLLQSLVEIP